MELPDVAPFDDPYKALKAILDAAVYQSSKFKTDWDAVDADGFTAGHWVALGLFSYFHLMFAVTCLTLLVRLLSAPPPPRRCRRPARVAARAPSPAFAQNSARPIHS